MSVPTFLYPSPVREELPCKMVSRDVSIWSILKNCIGKELSKIAMPIVFNEPLTFLQRMSESAHYIHFLEQANGQPDPEVRLQLISAFAVASVSSNGGRLNKPFNPLLGETFEMSRPDMGYRWVSEQVSHHPPISAFHGENESFILRGSMSPKLRFWGKSVEIKTDGHFMVTLKSHGETYTWKNVNCCVHNIIVGKLWFEQYGNIEIINHTTDWRGCLNFKQSGWFGKELNRVDGFIYDHEGNKVSFLYGKWNEFLKSVSIHDYEDHLKEMKKMTEKVTEMSQSKSFMSKLSRTLTSSSTESTDSIDGNITSSTSSPSNGRRSQSMVKSDSSFSINIHGSTVLWQNEGPPVNSGDYYDFLSISFALNQPLDQVMTKCLPPSDSRFRPDVRKMEEGFIDEASEEKHRLEEKQRQVRAENKKAKIDHIPLQEKNKLTRDEDWVLDPLYWDRDFSKCPNIF